MLSIIISFFPNFPGWLTLDVNPLESLLQGLVGACGISVLCNVIRVHLFLENERDESNKGLDISCQRAPRDQRKAKTGLCGMLQFLFLTGLLAVVGSRVASLVTLEFSLRAISAWVTAGSRSRGFLLQLLFQCQFTLGCALTCSLHFLHEGATQRWLCLLLAAALSWFLAKKASHLLQHILSLYKLHSSKGYCGVCISLLSTGSSLLPMLCRALIITFSVAALASLSIFSKHFLSAAEALRFWTPLTMCYALLLVYMQEEQQRQPIGEAVLNTVVVRVGGLMFLMLIVGHWADVLHTFLCFLGEASCLIPTKDIMYASCAQDEEKHNKVYVNTERHIKPTQRKEHHPSDT